MRLRLILLVVLALLATAVVGFLTVAAIDDVASRRSTADRNAAIALGFAAATLLVAALLKRWWLWLLPAAAWLTIVAIAVPYARQSGMAYVCGTAPGACYDSPYVTTSGWVVLSISLALIAAASCVLVALHARRGDQQADRPQSDDWASLPPTLA